MQTPVKSVCIEAIARGSACLAVGEHGLQLAEHYIPILAPGDSKYDDYELVDLTIADNTSYAEPNNMLEEYVQSQVKKGIKQARTWDECHE